MRETEKETEKVCEGYVCVLGVNLYILISVFVCMLSFRLSVHGFSLCISSRCDLSVRLCLRLCCVCASVCVSGVSAVDVVVVPASARAFDVSVLRFVYCDCISCVAVCHVLCLCLCFVWFYLFKQSGTCLPKVSLCLSNR